MIRTQCTNTVLNSLFLDICSARTPPRVLPATTAPTAWTSSTTGLASRAPLVATRRLLARQIARPVLRGQRLPRGARPSVTAWQAPRRGRATSSAIRLLPTWRRYTTRQTLQSRSSFDILTKLMIDAIRFLGQNWSQRRISLYRAKRHTEQSTGPFAANGASSAPHAQRQRDRRSRRAPPVLRQVLMHRHRHHSTRTRVASSSAAPPPLTSFHGDCKWLRQVLPGYSRVRVINNAVHGAHPQSQ